LLAVLKKSLGCGGTVGPGEVVIQGELVTKVEQFLAKTGCVSGIQQAKMEATGAMANVALAKAAASARPVSQIAKVPVERLSAQEIKKMKPAEMKKMLKENGHSAQGNKNELLSKMLVEFCIL
jgi:hypothetical protein